jgi:hypothetical protein
VDVKLLAPEGCVSLRERTAVSFQAPSGTTLRVTQGRVWVTQCCDERDHILELGDGFALNGRGKTTVYALAPATVWISPRNESPPKYAPRKASRFDAIISRFVTRQEQCRDRQADLDRQRVPQFQLPDRLQRDRRGPCS